MARGPRGRKEKKFLSAGAAAGERMGEGANAGNWILDQRPVKVGYPGQLDDPVSRQTSAADGVLQLHKQSQC